jgi:hypothetical protein
VGSTTSVLLAAEGAGLAVAGARLGDGVGPGLAVAVGLGDSVGAVVAADAQPASSKPIHNVLSCAAFKDPFIRAVA